MASLIIEIERFLRKHDMAETRFGREATRDPRFVADLRGGRALRPATEAKVRGFMEGYGSE